MTKVLDVRSAGGFYAVLGKGFVLPSSSSDGADLPLDGAIRFNPENGSIELYQNEVWTPIGGVTGSVASHTHPISQIIGLAAELSNKASTVHVHSLAEVTGLIPALDGKAPLVHNHNISSVVGLQGILDGLQTSVNAKANASHVHTIAEVTALQSTLNAKAAINHTHSINDIIGQALVNQTALRQSYSFCITGIPQASLRYVFQIAERSQIPAQFAGSIFRSSIPPTGNYTVQIFHNDLSLGSTILSSSNVATWSSPNPASILLLPGDRIEFRFPSTPDANLATASITLLTARLTQ